ncbi:MAG: hypothetical protein U1F43_03565 [Myxococcota bacterium]
MHAARLLALALTLALPLASSPSRALVGDALASYPLGVAPHTVVDLRGLAYDPVLNQLYALDAPDEVDVFAWVPTAVPGQGTLTWVRGFRLPDYPDPASAATVPFDGGAGLALTVENGASILYAVTSVCTDLHVGCSSRLVRVDLSAQLDAHGNPTSAGTSVVDLDDASYELHGGEVFDLTATADDKLILAYSKAGIPCVPKPPPVVVPGRRISLPDFCKDIETDNLLAGRGLLRLDAANGYAPKHMPDADRIRYPTQFDRYDARGVGVAQFENHAYLFASVEHDNDPLGDRIYAADVATGRGLFDFAAPVPADGSDPGHRRMAFGGDCLWVARAQVGVDAVDCVNVTHDLDVPRVDARRPRKYWVQLASSGDTGATQAWDAHNYGQPHGNDRRPDQGIDIASRVMTLEQADLVGNTCSGWRAAVVGSFNPFALAIGGAETQLVAQALFVASGALCYRSTFSIDYWAAPRHFYVYPHRTVSALADCQARYGPAAALCQASAVDDTQMFRFPTNTNTVYAPVRSLVVAYIAAKYGTTEAEVDMTTPYWIARNVQEWMRDTFNYPQDDVPVPSEVNGSDYDYTGSPGYWKLSYAFADESLTDADAFCDCIDAGGDGASCAPDGDGMYRKMLMCQSASNAYEAMLRYLALPTRWVGWMLHESEPDALVWNDATYVWESQDPAANPLPVVPPEVCHQDDEFEKAGQTETIGRVEEFCDQNDNGVFDASDWMMAEYGHQTSEVYLGSHYGWQRFDATPPAPGDADEDGDADCRDLATRHALSGQWDYLDDLTAAGEDMHVVATSMGVGLDLPFFQDDGDASKSNVGKACGSGDRCYGDVAYNFALRTSAPVERHGAGAQLAFKPALGFTVLVTAGPTADQRIVHATPTGNWASFLPTDAVEIVARNRTTHRYYTLAGNMLYNFGARTVTLSPLMPVGDYYFIVRRQGVDQIVGGASALIHLTKAGPGGGWVGGGD